MSLSMLQQGEGGRRPGEGRKETPQIRKTVV